METISSYRSAIFLFCVIFSAAILGGCQAKKDKPHEVWVKGRGIVSKLELFEDESCRLESICDVCEKKAQQGKWVASGSEVVLYFQNHGAQVFHREKYRGCDALLSKDQAGQKETVLPTEVFFRHGDSCSNSL